MSRSTSRSAARLSPARRMPDSLHGWPERRPEIIATVRRATGPLVGVDRVRVEAAHAPLPALGRLRNRYQRPAILDLPGPGMSGVVNPLTTSELLVFAAAEGFSSVTLGGVTNADQLLRAREALHPSIQLVAGISSARVVRESLGEICDAADTIKLDVRELQRALGARPMTEHVHWALVEAARRGIPCLLSGGLLPSLVNSLLPSQDEIDRIAELAELGVRGFVLEDETARGEHPAEAVQLLHSVLCCARRKDRPRAAGAARVDGPARIRAASLA